MSDDKRAADRHPREETIFIEILSSSDKSAKDNITVECTTKDISENGLKIHSAYPFIPQSILELLVNFESGGYKFLLTGEVRWVKNSSDEDYFAGFELIDAEHSDYLVWRKMFKDLS